MRSRRAAFDMLRDRSTMIVLIAALIAGAFVITAVAPRVFADVYTYFCVSVMMVLGLQMFMGNSGILNWTYVGFVGIGAFVASIMSTPSSVKAMGVPNMYPALVDLQMPILPALFVGALVAAAIAAVIAWPLMRLSDAVGVITLFATLIVIHVIMTQWDNVTNGPRTFFGVPLFTTLPIAVTGACLTLVVAHVFRESGLGLRLRASRDDRHAAKAIGINVVAVRYFSFVSSSFVAGLAGGLWAHYITSFSPKSFYITEAFVLLTMLVVGGSGSISGAVTGTAIVSVMRELLRQLEGYLNNSGVISFEVYGLTELAVAILLVIILIWRPEGIIGGREIRLPFLSKK
ncbi:MAG: branched-chain amino acid ABC transporter permease [Coriobacteriia bacterium]|nr:branched-chain amino acid ABC transporter permease [Coriobacteriia bacterium]